MLKGVLDQLMSLIWEESRAVVGAATAAPDACPRCGCPSFVKRGRDRDGRSGSSTKGASPSNLDWRK